jgi:diphosphomevalonate decarboxylase
VAIAIAHPNVALVKYWGKRPGSDDVPATPSLSVTLGALATRTSVAVAKQGGLRLNGRVAADAKIERFIAATRRRWELPPLAVDTANDFPTGAGLASSASGFAALTTAVDATFGLQLSAAERAAWARRGSVSAARSVFGGFATLTPADSDCVAAPLLGSEDWPLEVVVAVASETAKGVPSTAGMARSQATSPFYVAWAESTAQDFDAACAAVRARDFEALAAAAEHSSFKLHALMLSTRPALLYWNAATVSALHRVRELREGGVPVFASVDAGPQVKAVCAPGRGAQVAEQLGAVPGVLRVVRSGLGQGARPVAGVP